jgi:hypothetical protein
LLGYFFVSGLLLDAEQGVYQFNPSLQCSLVFPLWVHNNKSFAAQLNSTHCRRSEIFYANPFWFPVALMNSQFPSTFFLKVQRHFKQANFAHSALQLEQLFPAIHYPLSLKIQQEYWPKIPTSIWKLSQH